MSHHHNEKKKSYNRNIASKAFKNVKKNDTSE